MRNYCLALLLLSACVLLAQPQGVAVVPVSSSASVTFDQSWPAADPEWFELVFQPDGNATYRSRAHKKPTDPDPEPFEQSFTLSSRSRQQVFSLAPQLSRFRDSLDKTKVAFTGAKTLRYDEAPEKSYVLSYNYSSSPELNSLTSLIYGISETIELSQTLQFQLRFDKLSLDSTLRSAEDMVPLHRLSEPQLLEPILTRIANDPSVMNIARQRARRLLQSASGVAISAR